MRSHKSLKIYKEPTESKLSHGLEELPLLKSNCSVEEADVIVVPFLILENISAQPHFSSKIKAFFELPVEEGRQQLKAFHASIVQKFVRLYQKNIHKRYPTTINTPFLVFIVSDYEESYFQEKNIIFYKTSMFKSTKFTNDYLLPYPKSRSDIPYTPIAQTSISQHTPLVGFCGIINDPKRKDLLTAIHQHPEIGHEFLIRNRFFGHIQKTSAQSTSAQFRLDFIQNLLKTHFNISSRGRGNYSIRFYETLQAGRIPILIDSDIEFPFSELINWNELVICKKSPEEVCVDLLHTWKQKSIAQQHAQCREIWVQYLSPEGIEKSILQMLPTILQRNKSL